MDEQIVVLIVVGSIILGVIETVYYFKLCNNVSEILNRYRYVSNSLIGYIVGIRDKLEQDNAAAKDFADAYVAMKEGKTEEAYNNIIYRLTQSLYCFMPEKYHTGEAIAELESQINNAKTICAMLGRELPSELGSLDDFRKYYLSLLSK